MRESEELLRSVPERLYGAFRCIYVPCLIVSLYLIGITACRHVVREDIQPTTPAVPFYSMETAAKGETSAQWWQVFDDSLLSAHIQQALVMISIPFGLIGHIIMGYNLSIIPIFGMIALCGVLINGGLVFMVTANRYRDEGMNVREAAFNASVRRFRPIMLTSLTTFLGLAPIDLRTIGSSSFSYSNGNLFRIRHPFHYHCHSFSHASFISDLS